MGVRLALETTAARGARRALACRRTRRRHDASRGRRSGSSTPDAVDALAQRLPDGVAADLPATNGKTTTTAMAAEILGGRRTARVEPGRCEPALGDRVGARLGAATPISACSRSTRRRSRRRSRGCGRGSSRSATSSATSSTATASSSSSPSAGAPPSSACPATTTLVVNADDAVVADLADGRARRAPVRPRRPAPRPDAASARRGLEVLPALRSAVRVRRRVRRPPRRLPLPELRARAAAARRRREGHRAPRPACVAVRVVDAGRRHRRRARPPRSLQRLQRAAAACDCARRSGASLDEVRIGLERFGAAFGRFERITRRRQVRRACS